MKNLFSTLIIITLSISENSSAQPNWPAIRSNVTFHVADSTYGTPYIQPLHVGGWEDGLFISRDGLNLYSTYSPLDLLSYVIAQSAHSGCLNLDPYYRGPLFGVDTASSPYNFCNNWAQDDIVMATRPNGNVPFTSWHASHLDSSIWGEGAVQFIPKNTDTADVFVYSYNDAFGISGSHRNVIMFMKNVPNNPTEAMAVPIVQSNRGESNPHIERLNDSTLVLFFAMETGGQASSVYYSLSHDNGTHWQTPDSITHTLNDHYPFDVAPHLWNDGTAWWVFFEAPNALGQNAIYKSKQQIVNNWDSWGPAQLVIEPSFKNIPGGYGQILAVGEPTVTRWGDLSFAVVYGDPNSTDTADVWDADPWFLPKIGSLLSVNNLQGSAPAIELYPNPAEETLTINISDNKSKNRVQLLNSIGVPVKEFELQSSKEINIADLPRGLYFIKFENYPERTKKFIKQ